MKATFCLSVFLISCAVALVSCGVEKKQPETGFTKVDSLTETYLGLQDSMLQAWNIMIHDDNRKLTAMKNLLHELAVAHPEKKEEFLLYEERVEDLISSRYDQTSITDMDMVTEYDFASNALVTELIAVAESESEFVYNITIQRLVDEIRSADQRVNNYRDEYDFVAKRYNKFLEKNALTVKEINDDSLPGIKPLFQMASD